MTAHVKVGGVWRQFNPRMKIGGVWKNATAGWVKVAGVWRKFYDAVTVTLSPAPQPYAGSVTSYTFPMVTASVAGGTPFPLVYTWTIVNLVGGGSWTFVGAPPSTATATIRIASAPMGYNEATLRCTVTVDGQQYYGDSVHSWSRI
jgi:hypothetical protein